jgi:hypothetical protein
VQGLEARFEFGNAGFSGLGTRFGLVSGLVCLTVRQEKLPSRRIKEA